MGRRGSAWAGRLPCWSAEPPLATYHWMALVALPALASGDPGGVGVNIRDNDFKALGTEVQTCYKICVIYVIALICESLKMENKDAVWGLPEQWTKFSTLPQGWIGSRLPILWVLMTLTPSCSETPNLNHSLSLSSLDFCLAHVGLQPNYSSYHTIATVPQANCDFPMMTYTSLALAACFFNSHYSFMMEEMMTERVCPGAFSSSPITAEAGSQCAVLQPLCRAFSLGANCQQLVRFNWCSVSLPLCFPFPTKPLLLCFSLCPQEHASSASSNKQDGLPRDFRSSVVSFLPWERASNPLLQCQS